MSEIQIKSILNLPEKSRNDVLVLLLRTLKTDFDKQLKHKDKIIQLMSQRMHVCENCWVSDDALNSDHWYPFCYYCEKSSTYCSDCVKSLEYGSFHYDESEEDDVWSCTDCQPK